MTVKNSDIGGFMEQFVYTAFSFPTVVFTFLLALAVLFWMVSLVGLFDSDGLVDGLDGGDGGFEGTQGFLAGLLWRFRLVGYPLALVFTLVALLGWWICYYAMFFIGLALPLGWLRFPVGALLLPFALYAAAWLAGRLMRPLRRFFVQSEVSARGFVGQTAVVRTSEVNAHFGEALLDDGGAGLIVQVRSRTVLDHGARVVLLEFDADRHVYHVVSEDDFLGKARS